MKTVSVALVLCLNIDVDPPDVLKTSPCARMETWIGECSSPPVGWGNGVVRSGRRDKWVDRKNVSFLVLLSGVCLNLQCSYAK